VELSGDGVPRAAIWACLPAVMTVTGFILKLYPEQSPCSTSECAARSWPPTGWGLWLRKSHTLAAQLDKEAQP